MSSSSAAPTVAAFAHGPDEGEARWFLGGLGIIKASSESTDGRVAVIEHLMAPGPASPLHVHHREDEWFYIIDGELTFWVGGETIVAPAGSFVYGPREVPHTFSITSPGPARFLLVGEPAGFERFMRALSEPAASATLPPPPTSPPDFERLAAVAAEHGIDILGPPGLPS
jgi:mannose-6-phosphate isomerase-like protein (cupin superfamily)